MVRLLRSANAARRKDKMKSKHPPGPPMTLDNMRELGVRRLLVSCLNPDCRHEAVFDASDYPDDTEVSSFVHRIHIPPSRRNRIVVTKISDKDDD